MSVATTETARRRERAKELIASGMSKADAARALGVSQSTIAHDTNGRKSRAIPRAVIAAREAREKAVVRKRDRRPTDPVEENHADQITEADRWQRSLLNLAGDAIVLQDYWNREFLGQWKQFPVTQQLIEIARGAGDAWHAVAAELSKRSK